MKREHEQIWKKYADEGKAHKGHLFQVRNKLLGTVSPIPGNAIERFICDSDTYYIESDGPNVVIKADQPEPKVKAKAKEETAA